MNMPTSIKNHEEYLLGVLRRIFLLHRVAFAVTIAEKLYPNYVAFSKNKNWGDPNVLRGALDEIWKSIEEGQLMKNDSVVQLRKKIEDVTPDMDEFGSEIQGSLALDAAAAVYSALECSFNGSPEEAVSVAHSALSSKYMELEGSGERLEQSSEVQEEIKKQCELLERLQKLSKISRDALK